MNLRRFSRPDWSDDFFLLFFFDAVASDALLSSTLVLVTERWRWRVVDGSLWYVLHRLCSVGETNADGILDDDALCKVDTKTPYIIIYSIMSLRNVWSVVTDTVYERYWDRFMATIHHHLSTYLSPSQHHHHFFFFLLTLLISDFLCKKDTNRTLLDSPDQNRRHVDRCAAKADVRHHKRSYPSSAQLIKCTYCSFPIPILCSTNAILIPLCS